MPQVESIALIACIFLLAGWVKGVVGMGLPTVAMGALGLVMQPVQAAALLVVPSLVTNVWQYLAGPALRGIARRLATMLLLVCVGTAVEYSILTSGGFTLAIYRVGIGARRIWLGKVVPAAPVGFYS